MGKRTPTVASILAQYRNDAEERLNRLELDLERASFPPVVQKKKASSKKSPATAAGKEFSVDELKLAKMANLYLKAVKSPQNAFQKIKTTPAYMVEQYYDGLLTVEVVHCLKMAKKKKWTFDWLSEEVMDLFAEWQLGGSQND
jgi:hypothetical protein